MVAKLIKLSTDLVLSLIFLSIIGTSFVATLSLSPDALELFSTGSNVLGVSTDRTLTKNKFELTPYIYSKIFKVEDTNSELNYKYKVTTTTRSNSKVSDKVIIIDNQSERIEQLKIKLNTSEQNLKVANYGIEVNGSEQLLATNDYDTSRSIVLNIGPNQEIEMKAFVDFKTLVNYPIEFEIEATSL